MALYSYDLEQARKSPKDRLKHLKWLQEQHGKAISGDDDILKNQYTSRLEDWEAFLRLTTEEARERAAETGTYKIPVSKFSGKTPHLDEGEEPRIEDDIPVTKFTVTPKHGDATSIESGMEHLKYLRNQLAEETDEEKISNIKNGIKEWSAIMLRKHKSKPLMEYPEKRKNATSLIDLFNPSRPMGMR